MEALKRTNVYAHVLGGNSVQTYTYICIHIYARMYIRTNVCASFMSAVIRSFTQAQDNPQMYTHAQTTMYTD